MRRRTFACLSAAALLAGCTASSKEGRPPARLDGTWFGSWEGTDEFGFPVGSGFYFVLEHDEDTDLVTGTAFSSIAGAGTVAGQVNGSRFTLDVSYPGGDTESYSAREEFGTISGGDYDGTVSGAPFDGDFSMYPAELARKGTNVTAGVVSGRVFTGGFTTPLAGATVSIGAGEERLEATTNASGDYSFSFIAGGPRVVVVTADGGASAYVPIVVNGTTDVPDINIAPATAPSSAPVIELLQNPDGVTLQNSAVFAQGSVTQRDAPFVVASINSNEYLVPLDGNDFTYALILSRGVNTIVFQALNQVGVTERTVLVNADIQPQKIRVTLVWDQGTAIDGAGQANDQDLHIWQFPPGGGGGQHAFYAEPLGINDGELDIDNVFGFGPENFTMPNAPAGNYYIAVNFFAGVVTTECIVRVSLNENTPDERVYVYGPRLMTSPGGSYPVTVSTNEWWRVADLTVDGNGLASLATGTNPDTAFALPE